MLAGDCRQHDAYDEELHPDRNNDRIGASCVDRQTIGNTDSRAGKNRNKNGKDRSRQRYQG